MKKIFTLLCIFMMGTAAFAQDLYVFCDKDGNVYEEGATIECSEVEDDGFGGIIVPSGLYVKNVAAPDNYEVSASYNISKKDNGAIQLCFPTSCMSSEKYGNKAESPKATLAQGEIKNLMTEWFPTTYGECSVTYTLKAYQALFTKGSRTITVNYRWEDPASISQVKNGTTAKVTYYNLKGQRVEKPTKGLYILRSATGGLSGKNGKKVMVR